MKLKIGDKVVVTGGNSMDAGTPIWEKDRLYGTIIHIEPDPYSQMAYMQQGRYNSGQMTGREKIYIDWQNGYRTYHELHDINLRLLSDIINEEKEESKKSENLDLTPLSRLIIAEEAKEEIISVLKQHQHSSKIFNEWGLGEVIEYGRGMTFLFYGPPGTGKTWAANCIAKSLNKEMLVVSAAEIQSSEPGAANRNIKQYFREAQSKKKVLFLDECDSLIASRSDVGMVLSSEINTLLTEIEKFEGVVVLATNRIEELDEALERRIALIIEFPEPNYEQREGIWKVMLPKKMPLEDEVTVEKLSQHKLTGGQIKNVVLQAARLALASEAKKVGLSHFESAIARVQKSKSLMGTASRYRNFAMKESFGKGVRVGGQVSKRRSTDIDVTTDIKEEIHGPEHGEVRAQVPEPQS